MKRTYDTLMEQYSQTTEEIATLNKSIGPLLELRKRLLEYKKSLEEKIDLERSD